MMAGMSVRDGVGEFVAAADGVRSPATVRWYRQKLAALVDDLGDVALADVSVGDLRRWRAGLAAGRQVSPWTLHGYVRAVRRLFRWLCDEGLLAANPARRLELPALPDGEPRGVGDSDLVRLLAAARESGPRDYALVRFLASTGCRAAGVTGLRVCDVDLASRRARVREKGKGGNGRARMVFFDPETAHALAEWLVARPHAGDRVFVGKRGPLTGSGLYQALRRLARAAGVTGRWNPHAFRHGLAQRMLKAGANLAQVSQVLGHSDVSVTVRFYGQFAVDDLQACHAAYAGLPGRVTAVA